MGFWQSALGFLERRGIVYGGMSPSDPGLAGLWGYLGETAAGISVTPDNAMRSPAVAAAVRLLSETVATIPLDLFEIGDPGNGSRRATEQPLHALVHDAPLNWLSSTDWRRRMMSGVLLRGNQYSRITWGGDGTPQAIEPLPHTVSPKRVGNDIFYTVVQGGQRTTEKAIDILHIRGPFQSGDNLEAASPVIINRDLIARSLAAGEYISRFFSNSAVPKAKLTSPGNLSAEAAKRLREEFQLQHGGLENAHKLVIVPAGMTLEQLGTTNQEAQTLEIYKQSAFEIGSRLYGLPPHLSGDVDKQTTWGTGIEQMDLGYVKHVVRPYLVGIESALSMSLLTAAGRRKYKFEFNVDGLLRGDFASRMTGYAMLVQWGIMTVNEVRRLENMSPISGGDVRLVPLNYAPADQIMNVLLRDPAVAARAMAEMLIEMRGKLLPEDHGHA